MPVRNYKQQLRDEINQTPSEYLPNLLQIVRVYRESVTLNLAVDSFRQGMKEALQREAQPIEKLWEGIEAE
jgi:hypothetical protein